MQSDRADRLGRRRAFTLVEAMTVIAIIAVLMSLLLPVFSSAREAAHAAKCQSNLHQLMSAFGAFAMDHDDQLPGGYFDLIAKNDPNPDHYDWLRGDPWDWTSAPAGGTLFRYVNREPGVYRCPSLDPNPPAPGAALGSFAGSNGHYDYVSMLVFTGARAHNIPAQSRLTLPDGTTEYHATPIIVEGDPMFLNGFGMKDWHTGSDGMSHTHHGGAYYAAIDGSVEWINEPPGGCAAWSAQTHSGLWTDFANPVYYWGSWNLR